MLAKAGKRLPQSVFYKMAKCTVSSHFCGHPWGHHLVSVIVRVTNSGVQ